MRENLGSVTTMLFAKERNTGIIFILIMQLVFHKPLAGNELVIPRHKASPTQADTTILKPVVTASAVRQVTESLYSAVKDFYSADEPARSRVFKVRMKSLTDSLEKLVNISGTLQDSDQIKLNYVIGLSYHFSGRPLKSIQSFRKAIDFVNTDTANVYVEKVYYNLGTALSEIGDYVNAEHYYCLSEKCLLTNIPDSVSRAKTYVAISIANINLGNFEKALDYSSKALSLSSKIDEYTLPIIYANRGVALAGISDYGTSVHYLNAAVRIFTKNNNKTDGNYLTALNNLGVVFYNLGEFNACFEVYEKAMPEVKNQKSTAAFDFIRNYAIIRTERGNPLYGKKLFESAVEKISIDFPDDHDKIYQAQLDFARYLVNSRFDNKKAIAILKNCFAYSKSHPWNHKYASEALITYSTALLNDNKPDQALDSVNSILFRNAGVKISGDRSANPPLEKLKADNWTLNVLQTKYNILEKLATTDKKWLSVKAETSVLIIDLLEHIRLNIGEEKGMIVLGGKKRNVYVDAIGTLLECYQLSGDKLFLERAFQVSERSKAEALLTAMRDRRALQASIPEELIKEESRIQKDIDFYEKKSSEEKSLEKPDTAKINMWENNMVSLIGEKNRLKSTLEKKYPDYYTLRTNTMVVGSADIARLIGGKSNYLSYLVSDTCLYIFLVNKSGVKLVKEKIDTSFITLVKNYRKLISEPNFDGMAREEFLLFQDLGYRLYGKLIAPVSGYFIGDCLVISTDNYLSFFPFETLICENTKSDDLYYNRLPYLMKKYLISNVYSATLLSESGNAKSTLLNRSVAFAPTYPEPIIIDSISPNRQQEAGRLPELIFARDEAESVARITGGELYLDTLATKAKYLSVAGKYDIIHLAMHTVLNGKSPASTGMIFYSKSDPATSFLQPYEIYNNTLNAKMVVLSSCFTGVGTLYAGEGVLSIARGFIFSGSRSVVMSLWEVNDRSGTSIMKEFYSKLKAGKSKSEALREARLRYLETANMKQAHPYFWSTLVIYGDNSPLYFPSYLRLLIIFFPIGIAGFVLLYFWKRR